MDKSITKIKIRGYHLDVYQHVNNARFLEFFEEARWSHYEHYPPSLFVDNGWGFVVVNINVDYKHPALLGNELIIETKLVKIGDRSATLRQEATISSSGKLSAAADVTFVMLDLNTKQVLPIKGKLFDVLSGKYQFTDNGSKNKK